MREQGIVDAGGHGGDRPITMHNHAFTWTDLLQHRSRRLRRRRGLLLSV
jgi:hypothetical protein